MLSLTSCVGTVEDGSKTDSFATKTNIASVSFAGIYSAEGISDDKAAIYFYPAIGGTDLYAYQVYVGGEEDAVIVPSEVLTPDFRGLQLYIVTGLLPGKSYNFRVNVMDQNTGDVTETDAMKTATTFANGVADFMGVGLVSNLQGVAGLDGIKVRWSHATKDFGSLLGATDKDPKRYELIAIDADKLNPFDFDDWTLTQDDGRFIKTVPYNAAVNEVEFKGLPSGTRYYVQVRAIHEASVDDFNNLNLRGELNPKYFEISTYDSDLASIDFDPDSFLVINTEGEDSTNSMELQWGDVSGVFDHFRIYYSENSTPLNPGTITDECKSDGVPIGGVFCKKEAYFQNGSYVGGLIASSLYNFMIVVCQNAECTSKILSTVKQGSTLPVLADFNGILGIGVAESLIDLGTYYLEVEPASFEDGYFDGYIIGYKDSLLNPIYDKISETTYSGDLNVQPYNYKQDNEIAVTGIAYNSSNTYCFTVYPFIYDNLGGKIEYPNDKWQCRIPSYEPPTIDEFSGFRDGRANSNYLLLTWDVPLGGIFLDYEIYVRKTPGNFFFGEAIFEVESGNFTNYSKYSVSSTQQSVTLYLPNGTYKLGILTNYFTSTGSIKSEYNTQLLSCNVMFDSLIFCNPSAP